MFVEVLFCALMLVPGQSQASEKKPQPKTGQSVEKTAAQPQRSSSPSQPKEREINGVKLVAIEANLVSYTNQERVRYGLPPLEVDKELMSTAREHAAWMTRNRAMVHTRLPVAENIAMGQPHSSDAVRAWMNSSGHRANILSTGHRRVGVAAYRTPQGTIYWCQQFRR